MPAQAFDARVRAAFASLKAIRRFDEMVAHAIPIGDGLGYLACVCELHADDDQTIAKLAAWREAATSFHNTFQVTFDGTKRWLRERLLDVPHRILFLVLTRHGHAVGHMGFSNAVPRDSLLEVDNVIRGVSGVEPGIMSAGIRALLGWADAAVAPAGYWLRTYGDNLRAIEFYRRLGFRVEGTVPLRGVERGGQTVYEPRAEGDTAPPDLSHVTMRYR